MNSIKTPIRKSEDWIFLGQKQIDKYKLIEIPADKMSCVGC